MVIEEGFKYHSILERSGMIPYHPHLLIRELSRELLDLLAVHYIRIGLALFIIIPSIKYSVLVYGYVHILVQAYEGAPSLARYHGVINTDP